ncbi:hypothetical protein TNIN_287771 [Trichonephila inaurata madagascariensis]|uniref:C2H2-type domain-containing protein n=1 Tax=Trichonephila inaurata madagascariensis TaxID=2747483 RepID=A0A8X7CJ76_9ARAC|nr:hypothetical protein TNIN_287771 [Trichonephila inaurata madagascariensis]
MGDMPAEQAEDPKHACNTCHRTFQFRRHLLIHLKEHKENLFYKCLDCSAAFTTEIQLCNHQKYHAEEATSKCKYCSKTYSSPDILKLHENEHLMLHKAERYNAGITHAKQLETPTFHPGGKKQFSCQICEKSFVYKGNLEKHQVTHISEKPPSCPECGKTFELKKTLQQHLRRHTGRNLHKCDKCEKTFLSQNKHKHPGHRTTSLSPPLNYRRLPLQKAADMSLFLATINSSWEKSGRGRELNRGP